jgi:Cof subfamily protein (haloacid dehalogenase superfamily)
MRKCHWNYQPPPATLWHHETESASAVAHQRLTIAHAKSRLPLLAQEGPVARNSKNPNEPVPTEQGTRMPIYYPHIYRNESMIATSLLTPPARTTSAEISAFFKGDGTRAPHARTLGKLAAIDLDGTLLGPDHRPSAENLAAVARLQQRGITVVIASGRHFDSIAPIATQLDSVDWYVCSQGAEVTHANRQTVLERQYMTRADVELALAMGDQLGLISLVQVTEGTVTDAASNPMLAYHDRINGKSAYQIPRAQILERQVYKVLWIGEPDRIAGLRHLSEVTALPMQSLHTERGIFELMPHTVTKANGLSRLATHLGLSAADVVAFGDGENDIAMFKWAGASYAMFHGHPNALAAAKLIAPSGPPASALARAIDAYLTS